MQISNKDKIAQLFNNILFPIILIVYPLYGFNIGADLSDTTYSLANYMFFSDITGSWKYATFISNLTGAGLFKVSGGQMIMMNILTGLFISAIAVIAYQFLKKRYNYIIVFIAEIIAICLSWCPSVILYNYLTYLLFALGIIILYKAIICNDTKWYIVSGAILGINVFVRISNVVEVALIVVLWYAVNLLYKKGDDNRKFVKPTLMCMAGFAIGLVLSIMLIVITSGGSGIGETIKWAVSLFSSNDSAGGYSLTEMIAVIFNNYLGNFKYFALAVVFVILGTFGYRIYKDRLVALKNIVFSLGIIVLFVYYFRNGVFTANYHNNGAIFGICVLVIMWQYVVFIYALLSKKLENEDKILSAFMIMVLIITPLGSNNHLFTIINNMFLTLPVCAGIFIKLYRILRENESYKGITTPVLITAISFLAVLLIQGIMFKMQYTFCDGEDGISLDSKVESSSTLKGMITSYDHADAIDGLCNHIDTDGRSGIFYGNIPGVSYLLKMPAKISTFWPDLDSYSEDDFKCELEAITDNYPMVIISKIAYDRAFNGKETSNKDNYIKAFMIEGDYHVIYTNKEFVVLDRSSND